VHPVTGSTVPGCSIRVVPWQAPVTASAVSVLAVGVGLGQGTALPLQVAGILLAASAAFALDDPAFEFLAASPTSLMKRRLARLIVVISALTALWTVLLLWRRPADLQETWTLVVMFAGLLALSVGASAAAGRRTGGWGAAVAAPCLLLALAVSSAIPPHWRPLPLGDIPGGWAALQARWTAACLTGALVLVVSSRDPMSRRPRRRRCRPGTAVRALQWRPCVGQAGVVPVQDPQTEPETDLVADAVAEHGCHDDGDKDGRQRGMAKLGGDSSQERSALAGQHEANGECVFGEHEQACEG
jgi:hypothetical protein